MVFDIDGLPLVPTQTGQGAGLDACVSEVDSLQDVAWAYAYGANDGSLGYDGKHTVCNPQFLFLKSGTTITAQNSYRFSVCLYSTQSAQDFVSKKALNAEAYTIPEDCYARISVALPTTGDINDIYSAVANVTLSQSGYILDPLLYSYCAKPEALNAAVLRFVDAMNERAQQIGMTNSVFADPAGYDTATNRVTARDLVKLGVEACSYRDLCKVWQTNTKTIYTLDSNHREIVCEYGDDTTALDAAYPILGKKNGYMPLSGGESTYTMVAVCVVDGKVVVGAIGGATSRQNRPIAMKELMDNVHAILNNGTASTPTYYTRGCAAELPFGNPSSYERKPLNYLYEYNADTQFVPASATKVLTAITMLDYATDVHEKFTALASDDLSTGSGQLLQDGDVINYEQALYLMMLPSSGPTCRALARTLGQRMLVAYD